MVKRSLGVEGRLYVIEKAQQAKKECYGKHPDYKRLVLKQTAAEISPYRVNLKTSYAERRERFDRNGNRHWSKRPCFCCDSGDNIHVHHIVPLAHGGTNDQRNLINVCRDCHSYIHGFEVK